MIRLCCTVSRQDDPRPTTQENTHMDDIYNKEYFLDLLALAEKNEAKARDMGRVDLAEAIALYVLDLAKNAKAAT